MDKKLRETLDSFHTPDLLLRKTRAGLRKRTFDYGRNLLRLGAFRRRLVTACLSLLLVLTGVGVWFIPSASISVDVNPSVELKVNALDRVISLEGRNSDGIALASHLDLTGMPYDEAMQRLLIHEDMQRCLETGATLTITVAGGGTDTHAGQMLSKVLCRAYALAEEENILYCQVDWETVKAARKVNLCIPRYLAWQRLLQTDPAITPEDVRAIPREEIRILAQIVVVENPCGE